MGFKQVIKTKTPCGFHPFGVYPNKNLAFGKNLVSSLFSSEIRATYWDRREYFTLIQFLGCCSGIFSKEPLMIIAWSRHLVNCGKLERQLDFNLFY